MLCNLYTMFSHNKYLLRLKATPKLIGKYILFALTFTLTQLTRFETHNTNIFNQPKNNEDLYSSAKSLTANSIM